MAKMHLMTEEVLQEITDKFFKIGVDVITSEIIFGIKETIDFIEK